jgi:hypothetical protein
MSLSSVNPKSLIVASRGIEKKVTKRGVMQLDQGSRTVRHVNDRMKAVERPADSGVWNAEQCGKREARQRGRESGNRSQY